MRADRLVAALLTLQSRGRTTAAELAAELEVSVATARRDLEALSGAGVPVYAQPGRGGGWALVGGARTDLTGLRADEARALFALVGGGDRSNPAVRSALRKLVRALPATFRDEAEAAGRAVLIDPSGWGELPAERPAHVDTLQAAIARRRRVRFDYRSRSRTRGDESVSRSVEPWLLAAKKQTWYLLAADDHGRRTYRLDRISDLQVLDEPAAPPPVDVEHQWQQVAEGIEELRSAVRAEVLIDTDLVAVLQTQLGRHCRVLGPNDEGQHRTRVQVSASTVLEIARHLAGWGGLIDCVDVDVRAALAHLGAELVAANRPAD